MILVVLSEAEGAESAVHTIQAVHVALALVGMGVHLALNEESLFQQRLQPRRPPLLLLVRASRTLLNSFNTQDFDISSSSNNNKRTHNHCILNHNENRVWLLTMILLFLGLISRAVVSWFSNASLKDNVCVV